MISSYIFITLQKMSMKAPSGDLSRVVPGASAPTKIPTTRLGHHLRALITSLTFSAVAILPGCAHDGSIFGARKDVNAPLSENDKTQISYAKYELENYQRFLSIRIDKAREYLNRIESTSRELATLGMKMAKDGALIPEDGGEHSSPNPDLSRRFLLVQSDLSLAVGAVESHILELESQLDALRRSDIELSKIQNEGEDINHRLYLFSMKLVPPDNFYQLNQRPDYSIDEDRARSIWSGYYYDTDLGSDALNDWYRLLDDYSKAVDCGKALGVDSVVCFGNAELLNLSSILLDADDSDSGQVSESWHSIAPESLTSLTCSTNDSIAREARSVLKFITGCTYNPRADEVCADPPIKPKKLPHKIKNKP